MNFIFDLYGTLVDIKTDESKRTFWKAMCEQLGLSKLRWRTLMREYHYLCADKMLSPEHEIDLSDVFGDLLVCYGKERSESDSFARIFREKSTERLGLFPNVQEMLLFLRKMGSGVYLLSNAQSCFTRNELDLLGLTPLFDGIIISSEVSIKKPSEKIFQLALDRFGLDPDECIYVGNDMLDDVFGASRAKLKTVYIQTEQSRKYDAKALPSPNYTATDHEDLYKLLLTLASKS